VARCAPGTREQLLRIISTWLEEEDNRFPICWLSGPPGSGKSAVSQTVAELWDSSNKLAASFFFQRSTNVESNIIRLIHTLAYDLSCHAPDTKPLIQNVLQHDKLILKKAPSHQFRKLLTEPFLTVEGANQAAPRVIVIDDIHECDDKEAIDQFIINTFLPAATCRLPFRFFLTSRNEAPLQRLGAPPDRPLICSLDLQNFDTENDIRKFFRSAINQDNPESIEALVKSADGSFRSAVEIGKRRQKWT
jgi:uridine kinase